jgi:hypothetical protein
MPPTGYSSSELERRPSPATLDGSTGGDEPGDREPKPDAFAHVVAVRVMRVITRLGRRRAHGDLCDDVGGGRRRSDHDRISVAWVETWAVSLWL